MKEFNEREQMGIDKVIELIVEQRGGEPLRLHEMEDLRKLFRIIKAYFDESFNDHKRDKFWEAIAEGRIDDARPYMLEAHMLLLDRLYVEYGMRC